eukprot:696811-Amphidinium_carterae.1
MAFVLLFHQPVLRSEQDTIGAKTNLEIGRQGNNYAIIITYVQFWFKFSAKLTKLNLGKFTNLKCVTSEVRPSLLRSAMYSRNCCSGCTQQVTTASSGVLLVRELKCPAPEHTPQLTPEGKKEL